MTLNGSQKHSVAQKLKQIAKHMQYISHLHKVQNWQNKSNQDNIWPWGDMWGTTRGWKCFIF